MTTPPFAQRRRDGVLHMRALAPAPPKIATMVTGPSALTEK